MSAGIVRCAVFSGYVLAGPALRRCTAGDIDELVLGDTAVTRSDAGHGLRVRPVVDPQVVRPLLDRVPENGPPSGAPLRLRHHTM
ncbi:MAG: hypothetical protein ACKOOG_03345 [Actinomycetota bacterium]